MWSKLLTNKSFSNLLFLLIQILQSKKSIDLGLILFKGERVTHSLLFFHLVLTITSLSLYSHVNLIVE